MLRRLGPITALLAAGAIFAPGSASAATVSTDCAGFPATLAAATSDETIVLSDPGGLCVGQMNTIPASASNLTIEGAAGGVNGFNGGGAAAPALSGTNTNGLTVQNLVFENYTTSAVSFVTSLATTPYVFSGDTFVNNHSGSSDGGGLRMEVFGVTCSPVTPTITLTGSNFTGNSTAGLFTPGGGGGALLDLECTGGSTGAISVAGNTFSGNSVVAPVNQPRMGGGLMVTVGRHIGTAPIQLNQSDNLFQGNSVVGSGAAGWEGGGEFTAGMNLTSTNDRFIANSVTGSGSASADSAGGGLSTRSGGGCTTTPGVTSSATNMVVAGNSIGPPSGTGTGGEGAGVYAGCSLGTGGYDLTLRNSTISGNQVSGGGIAGAAGEATDQLHLNNAILIGNAGGPDLGGFGATDGALATAQNSDVCAIGSGSPFAGAGNICADPGLVNPAAGDIKETPGSPTIDRGDNSLVGVATDVFGGPRILVGRPGDAAIVDMGAFELRLPSNHFDIVGVQGKTLIVNVDSPGKVDVSQAGAGKSSVAVEAKKKKKKKSKLLLNPSSASGGPGQLSIPLLLTKKGKQQLKKKGKVSISSTVSFTPTGGEKNSKSTTLQIKNKKKKKKKK